MSDIRFEEMLINNLKEEIKELKQQLAEKEKLIEDYSAFFNQLFNQDKISFALEQLEKVKEFYNTTDKTVYYEYCPGGYDTAIIKDNLLFNIDNQIKQLKEMK